VLKVTAKHILVVVVSYRMLIRLGQFWHSVSQMYSACAFKCREFSVGLGIIKH